MALAVEKCVQSRLWNSGQSCISAKRFIIEEPIYDAFVKVFKEKLKDYKPGNPLDEKVNLAPLARESIRSQFHEQVMQSIEKGAQCIVGGAYYRREGFYYQPTILSEVKPGMPAYDEELFGPVASMIKTKHEQEAIFMANDTPYGLGGGIFFKDVEKAEKIAKYNMESGACFVNNVVTSDPRFPFGGVKQSGYGRELSHHGILEFTNIKTICIDKC